jgi:TPP-dependent pyruvate/acetoin dehydrogenase alpha subunit
MAAAELVHVPRALGIATDVVNGADPEAVYAAVALALGRLRKGEGPAFVEARTQRWPGSRPIWPELATGVLDLALAWEPERIAGPHAAWIRQHDPILRYARALTDRGDFETAELCAIDARVGERIAAAKAEAVASPWPEADAALAGAFA